MAKRSGRNRRPLPPRDYRSTRSEANVSPALVIIILLALFALIVGSLQLSPPPPPAATASPSALATTPPTPGPSVPIPSSSGFSIDGDGRRLGPPDTTTIDVWNDLSCRECRQWSMNILLDIMTREVAAGEAHILMHDFVADNDGSRLAARASWAAEQQGDFWAFYLAAHSMDTAGGPGEQGEIPFTRQLVEQIARIAELDMTKFASDLDSEAAIAAVADAQDEAQTAGVDEAPSVRIGDEVLVAPSADKASEVLSAAE